MSIIFSSDHLEVHYSEGTTDYLLITFNNFAILADGKTFWGQRFIESAKISCVSFMVKERSWFPDLYMSEAITLIRDILANYTKIVAYGNSMGAYAALKYASQLGVTHVLAFNPQYSIEPGRVKSDNRFTSYFKASIHEGMEIVAGDVVPFSYVIYDPSRADDNEHAELIAQNSDVTLVPVKYSDHVTVRIIGGYGRAALLINWLATTDTNVSSELHKKLNIWKKDLIHYRLYLAIAMQKAHPDWAVQVLESIMRLPTLDSASGAEACRLLMTRGYPDIARGLASKMLEKFPGSGDFSI